MQNNFQYEKIVFFSPRNLKSQKLVGEHLCIIFCDVIPHVSTCPASFEFPRNECWKSPLHLRRGLQVSGSQVRELPWLISPRVNERRFFFSWLYFQRVGIYRYIHITHNIQGLSEVFQCDWCKKPETQLDNKWIIN